jgi:thioredoxin
MEITTEELKLKIESGEKIILDVYAKWCSPCMAMKPTFEKLSQELIDKNSDVKLYTLNVDENRDIAIQYGIRSVPTIKIFNNGVVVDTKVGIQSENQLTLMVNSLLNG